MQEITNMLHIIDCTWKHCILSCPHRIYNKEMHIFNIINSEVHFLILPLHYIIPLGKISTNSKYKSETRSIILWSHWKLLQYSEEFEIISIHPIFLVFSYSNGYLFLKQVTEKLWLYKAYPDNACHSTPCFFLNCWQYYSYFPFLPPFAPLHPAPVLPQTFPTLLSVSMHNSYMNIKFLG